MKKIIKITVFLLLAGVYGSYGQIQFFDGSFQQALEKAKKEQKKLFVDFYTDWCEPCKLMSKEIFTLADVGEYFNKYFVCCKVNAERDENKVFVQRYGVDAFPMLLFLDTDGKELRKIRGAVQGPELLKEAKIATGEELTYEQLYQSYKKDKKDLEIVQQLLMEAPIFIQTVQGYERDKWSARIDALFKEYMKNKDLSKMINQPDFMILTMFHPQTEKVDPIFDFIVKNFDKYAAAIDQQVVADYIISLNNAYIISLCKKGNQEYKNRLKRVDGDLMPVYADMTFGSLSVSQAINYLSDATYYLYRNDYKQFFDNMDKYFNGAGASLTVNDYTQPIEDLYGYYQGKLPETAQVKCIEWIGKALEKSMNPSLKTRLLIMMGECYGGTGDPGKAKQCYNQAYITSSQIENKGLMKQLQEAIQSKLQGL